MYCNLVTLAIALAAAAPSPAPPEPSPPPPPSPKPPATASASSSTSEEAALPPPPSAEPHPPPPPSPHPPEPSPPPPRVPPGGTAPPPRPSLPPPTPARDGHNVTGEICYNVTTYRHSSPEVKAFCAKKGDMAACFDWCENYCFPEETLGGSDWEELPPSPCFDRAGGVLARPDMTGDPSVFDRYGGEGGDDEGHSYGDDPFNPSGSHWPGGELPPGYDDDEGGGGGGWFWPVLIIALGGWFCVHTHNKNRPPDRGEGISLVEYGRNAGASARGFVGNRISDMRARRHDPRLASQQDEDDDGML